MINPLNPRVESAEEVADGSCRAADFIPKERSARPTTAASRRSASTRSPTHGSPDHARDMAFEKITNRVEGTTRAAERLGLS